MRILRYLPLFLLLLVVAACQLDGGTAAPEATVDPSLVEALPISTRSFEMGTAGFVPAGYPDPSNKAWQEFFHSGVSSYGSIYGVHLSPAAPKNDKGVLEQAELAFEQVEVERVYIALAVSHEAGPFTEERGRDLVDAAVAIAEHYDPAYLSLGVESNSFYLFQADSFDLYVDYVFQAYGAVKEIDPDIKIMNNFQLDRMKGESDLAGENFEPHWELLERFDGAMDLVSFTVYPFLHYSTVEEIPPDYLAEIREHTELPVVITETGWPSERTASGVQGSPDQQVDYLLKLSEQANGIETETLIWVFPHDADFGIAGGIFDHISLLTNAGQPKPAYHYWQALQALPLQ